MGLRNEVPLPAAACAAAPRAGLRVRASVVVARMRGLTRAAVHLEATCVARLLEEFFAAMTDVAVGHRAVIDTLLGDAIVLLYGVPVPGRDDALRAVRSAVEMQRAFLALRNRWAARGEASVAQVGLAIGAAAGEIVIASLRPGMWLDCTAVGEPVNTAVDLCTAARGGETLIDEAAHASAFVRLEDELRFTSCTLGARSRAARLAYRVGPQRAGLRVVAPRPALDPVCGSVVDPRRGVREGDRYFCSAACARRFLDERGRGG